MSPRERAYAAFLRSEGALLEPSAGQQRRVRARAAPPPPPVQPPAGPRPNQLALRQAIAVRVDRKFSDAARQNGFPAGATFEERVAKELVILTLKAGEIIDDVVDVDDKTERLSAELTVARQVIADLTARLARLEEIERADTKAARATARLKASRE